MNADLMSGTTGGSCTCPDGTVYIVGSYKDEVGCVLGCDGGGSSECTTANQEIPKNLMMVTCGQDLNDGDDLAPELSDDNSLQGVRCCEDVVHSGGATGVVCTGLSEQNEECYKNGVTFFEAQIICKAEGKRLCSQQEIEAGFCCGQGCGLDQGRIWSLSTENSSE